MSKLKIKNRYIVGLFYWLQDLMLKADDNKTRVKFLVILQPQINAIENQRIVLLKKYAKKDKDGEPVIIISNKAQRVYDVEAENGKLLNEEYGAYLETEFVIEINESNKELISKVKDLILNTDYLFGIKEGMSEDQKKEMIQLYTEYCEWNKIFSELK